MGKKLRYFEVCFLNVFKDERLPQTKADDLYIAVFHKIYI